MIRTPKTVTAPEPTQQSDPKVTELQAQVCRVERELAATKEKLTAANQEIEILKAAALQARRMAAGFA
jgi:ABC-type arginine transport system ATPase subunit